MTDEQNIIIQNLKEKVKKVIFLYYELRKEKDELLEKNEYLVQRLRKKEEKIEDLSKKYNNLKFTKTFTASIKDVKESKKKINEILSEIDKCIFLLNL